MRSAHGIQSATWLEKLDAELAIRRLHCGIDLADRQVGSLRGQPPSRALDYASINIGNGDRKAERGNIDHLVGAPEAQT
jgi:hypothetical protein